jgi:adenylate cyclase
MEHNCRVFISSTQEDLEDHRRCVIDTLRTAGYEPVCMEEWPAAGCTPLDICRKAIQSCTSFVVIVAWMIGNNPEGEQRSFVELEYEEALSFIPQERIFAFLHSRNAAWPRKYIDKDQERIERFRQKLENCHTRSHFKTPEDLANHVLAALSKATSTDKMKIQDSSIVILPFIDMSSNKDQEYFCDGMAEELINTLVKNDTLKVIARTSAFSYKNRAVNVRQISKELNVAYVLEGSVRKEGEKLRVTAQLIDATNDFHIWSDNYDRSAGDIFSIQDEITSAIVDRLAPHLINKSRSKQATYHPIKPEVYNLYLKGCYFRGKGRPGDLQKAFEYFKQAIQEEPNYALAYAAMALCYSLLPFYSQTSPKQVIPQAKQMAIRALQINESLSEAHEALGFTTTWYDWDWNRSEKHLLRACEINPGGDRCHLWYAYYLMLRHRHVEALEQIQIALALDPVSVVLNRDLGMIYYFAGKYDKAIDSLQYTIEMDPYIMYTHFFLGASYLAKSMHIEALKEFEQEEGVAGSSHTCAKTFSALTHIQMEHKEQAQIILNDLLAQSKDAYISPFHICCLYFGLQQNDEGFHWLNVAYETKDHWLHCLETTSVFKHVLTDPRYVILQKKLKFSE